MVVWAYRAGVGCEFWLVVKDTRRKRHALEIVIARLPSFIQTQTEGEVKASARAICDLTTCVETGAGARQ